MVVVLVVIVAEQWYMYGGDDGDSFLVDNC